MGKEEQNDISNDLHDVADELRAIGQTGLFYARREDDEYDVARYERVLALAARVFALTDTRAAAEIVAPTLVVPDNEGDQMLWNKRRSKLARKLRPHQIVPAMARQRDAGTDLGADRDAALVALGKAGRRRLRRRGLLHMARVRLLMTLGLVRRVTVEYAPSL